MNQDAYKDAVELRLSEQRRERDERIAASNVVECSACEGTGRAIVSADSQVANPKADNPTDGPASPATYYDETTIKARERATNQWAEAESGAPDDDETRHQHQIDRGQSSIPAHGHQSSAHPTSEVAQALERLSVAAANEEMVSRSLTNGKISQNERSILLRQAAALLTRLELRANVSTADAAGFERGVRAAMELCSQSGELDLLDAISCLLLRQP